MGASGWNKTTNSIQLKALVDERPKEISSLSSVILEEKVGMLVWGGGSENYRATKMGSDAKLRFDYITSRSLAMERGSGSSSSGSRSWSSSITVLLLQCRLTSPSLKRSSPMAQIQIQKYKYKAQLLMVFAYISITHSGLSQTCHNTRCPNILTFRSFANILSATTAAQQIKETAQWNIIDPA